MIKSIQKSLAQIQDKYKPSFDFTQNSQDFIDLNQSRFSQNHSTNIEKIEDCKNFEKEFEIERKNKIENRKNISNYKSLRRVPKDIRNQNPRGSMSSRRISPKLESSTGENSKSERRLFGTKLGGRRDFKELKQKVISHMMKNLSGKDEEMYFVN